MFLPIAVLAATAVVGCATLAGSDLGISEVMRMTEEERNPAYEPELPMHAEFDSARMGIAHACHAQDARMTRTFPPRPGLLDSMQARALGCLD